MRLLTIDSHGQLSLTKDLVKDIPRYAILSHTWGPDEEEITFKDLNDGSYKSKAGHKKIRFCGEQAQKDGLQYFWVDTCAIDKANHTELSEAIISMFRWYQNAEKCYVYLSDVSIGIVEKSNQTERTWETDFRKSRWFTRGWTLQELLAPKSVEFFSQDEQWLGNKCTLERVIHETTEISLMALRGIPLPTFSVEERMRWAVRRHTTREEDRAYCLQGIFNVFLSPMYGEGQNAFIRLQGEIDRLSGSKVDLDKLPSGRGTSSVWYVPFRQTSEFVGRTDELQYLKQKVLEFNSHQVVSLLGLGGVGKSRLALELVYQIKSEHPQYSVCWVEATDPLTFERDIIQIGKEFGIPGIEDDKADIKALVKQWLSRVFEGRWLLILDNADDEAVWAQRPNSTDRKSSLVDSLPSSANGSILITTRSRRVASYLAGKHVTELQAMSLDEARTMFISALEKPEIAADENISVLLDKLTYLPLAIAQASAYINMTQESIRTYLDLMNEPEEEVVKLLSDDFGDLSRYSSAHNAVATTWLISFNQIHQYHPLAEQFLSSMACFQEKNIPHSLLPVVNSKKDAFDALATLKGYSFLTVQRGGNGETNSETLYDMHHLVHLAARNWLKMNDNLSDSMKACIKQLAELFPTPNHENRHIWTIYLPHAQRLCDSIGTEDYPEQDLLLEKMGWCLLFDGKYSDAVKIHSTVVKWRENKLGLSDEETLSSYNDLGEALTWAGDFPTAEVYIEKAFRGQKEILGAEHPDTLTSMANLASIYSNQGQWKKAEELEMQVLEIRKRVLGPEHPDTLSSIANLASTYRNQGRWKEAEELEVQVLEIRKRVLGPEYPDTLSSIANLASTYWNQGRWKEAEELDMQVLEIRKRVLGPEHPDTLFSIANLASTYRNQGQWKEAEELEVQVLEISKRVLGPEHPDTLSSIANLASIYWNQGRWKEAEGLDMQVLEIRKRVLGPEHPDTLFSIANLASTYQNQGRWKEAEELEVQVLEIRKRVLGLEHPDTLSSIANLVSTYRNQGRWKEAEELEVQVLEIRKRVLGPEHPDTLSSIANLASTYWNQGRWKEAEELDMQVLEIRKRVLGPEHPDTLFSIANLASTYQNQGRWKEAEELDMQVLEIRKRVLGLEHPDTLTSMASLAHTRKGQNNEEEAMKLMASCVELSIKVLGPSHHRTQARLATQTAWKSTKGEPEYQAG